MNLPLKSIIVTTLLVIYGHCSADTPYTGVVKSIDSSMSKIGITHQGVPALEMPAMTMKFKYEGDLTMFSEGDQIKFNAIKSSKGYEITEIKITKKAD